jgi:hypothetical protein
MNQVQKPTSTSASGAEITAIRADQSTIEVHIDLNGHTRRVGTAHSRRARGNETVVFEYASTWLSDRERFSIEPSLAVSALCRREASSKPSPQ